MLCCPVADAIMWEPELNGVVIATSHKNDASRVHFVCSVDRRGCPPVSAATPLNAFPASPPLHS